MNRKCSKSGTRGSITSLSNMVGVIEKRGRYTSSIAVSLAQLHVFLKQVVVKVLKYFSYTSLCFISFASSKGLLGCFPTGNCSFWRLCDLVKLVKLFGNESEFSRIHFWRILYKILKKKLYFNKKKILCKLEKRNIQFRYLPKSWISTSLNKNLFKNKLNFDTIT